ncbi:Hypothetical protein BHY_0170 [Borrelia nietonii YOR]|uniref:Uncharacterized protein n=1 Tax=Borrelia nietonii YOR TaxID=1293576 RepID=A0ABM5PGC5_9SPIR|nr:Hypothetical protein BHY_0170 [Borrelia nietonii YOR]AHH13659.1 Hypothetical protein BHW_0099300 [Borrelia hermsii MTW]
MIDLLYNKLVQEFKMAKISKNAQRSGSKELLSKWGGKIIMKSKFENGKIKHYAECQASKNTARRPKDLF